MFLTFTIKWLLLKYWLHFSCKIVNIKANVPFHRSDLEALVDQGNRAHPKKKHNTWREIIKLAITVKQDQGSQILQIWLGVFYSKFFQLMIPMRL